MARSPSADAAEAPGALERVLRAGRRRQVGALAVECALLGLGAAGATAAAAVVSGELPTATGTLLASAIAGLACAACWWLERREDPARLARRIDRRTVGDGSFVTAVECERDGRRGPLAEALVRRTRGRVGPADARRAMRPPAVALLALPLLALAVLAQLDGGSRAPGKTAPARAPELSLERVAAALRGPAGEGPGGERDPELERLLAGALEQAGGGDRAGLREALERLADALGRRLDHGEGAGPGAARAEELERALELVRAASPGSGRGSGAGQGSASGGSGWPDPQFGSAAAAAPGDRRLDAERPGVTMAGSPDPDGDAGPPADPGTADAARNPEPGVLVGRTWDARYDGVVDAWLRRSGAASSGAGASEHDFE